MPRVPKEVSRERERRAWQLRQQLWTQERIAAELGVDQTTVSAALRRIERRVLDELSEQVQEAKARQTAQLERLASEAIEAWERSKLDAESVETTEEQTTLEGAGGYPVPAVQTRTKRTSKGQSGDPRHLDNAMKALTDIRGIWGMDAPTKHQHGGRGMGPIEVIEVVRPSDIDDDSDGPDHAGPEATSPAT